MSFARLQSVVSTSAQTVTIAHFSSSFALSLVGVGRRRERNELEPVGRREQWTVPTWFGALMLNFFYFFSF